MYGCMYVPIHVYNEICKAGVEREREREGSDRGREMQTQKIEKDKRQSERPAQSGRGARDHPDDNLERKRAGESHTR